MKEVLHKALLAAMAAAVSIGFVHVTPAQQSTDPSLLGGSIGPTVTGTIGPGTVVVNVPAPPAVALPLTNNQMISSWLVAENQAAIQLGRLAESHAQSEHVRSLARRLVQEHGQMQETLQRLGGRLAPAPTIGSAPALAGPMATSAALPRPGQPAIFPNYAVGGAPPGHPWAVDPRAAAANRAGRESLFAGRASDAVQGQNKTVPSGVTWVDRNAPHARLGSAGGPAGSSVGASSLYRAGLSTMASRDSTPMPDLDRAVENARGSMLSGTSETAQLRNQLATEFENKVAVPGNPLVALREVPAPPLAGAAAGAHDLLSFHQQVARQELALAEQDLSKRQGSDFDQAYLNQQIAAHVRMLATLGAARDSVSPGLRRVIDKGIRTMDQNLSDAQSILERLESRAIRAVQRPNGPSLIR